MVDTAYYVVRSGKRVLGRHCLAWPEVCPPVVWNPLRARWYRDYPDATIEKDPDQTSTATGVYVARERGQFRYQRELRTALQKALKHLSKREVMAMLDELAP